MQLSILSAYSGGLAIGQRKLFCFSAVGPASYNQTTSDPVSLPTGEYADYFGEGVSVSKTYRVLFFPSAVGSTRASWVAKWYVIGGAEVANAVNLSGESIQAYFFGGEF